jgi:hypothetical protein
VQSFGKNRSIRRSDSAPKSPGFSCWTRTTSSLRCLTNKLTYLVQHRPQAPSGRNTPPTANMNPLQTSPLRPSWTLDVSPNATQREICDGFERQLALLAANSLEDARSIISVEESDHDWQGFLRRVDKHCIDDTESAVRLMTALKGMRCGVRSCASGGGKECG